MGTIRDVLMIALNSHVQHIGVGHWVHVYPRGGGKNGGFTGESCKCTPRHRVHPPPDAEKEYFFKEIGEIWTVRGYFCTFSVCLECDN